MYKTSIQEKLASLMGKKTQVTNLSIEEQAASFFSKIYLFDDLKFNMYLALTSPKQMNVLLYGPPASAKSLFMKIIEENCEDVLYFDASNASGAGLIEVLNENQNKKIILIDEIGMLNKTSLDALRGLLNDGHVVKTLKKKNYDIQMPNVKVFATTNDLNMPKPILSRFMVYQLPPYSDEEFVRVSQHCLQDEIPAETAEIIANVMTANNMKDIRKVIHVAGSIRREFTMEQVVKVIETMIRYKQLAQTVDYN
jgi:replication-associated recombination protein RarA